MPANYLKKRTFARELRRNMTKEERHLWYDFLQRHSMRFLRQKMIGAYIVDFYCPEAKLVIELDGSQHFDEDALRADERRSEFLQQQGLRVIRFTNRQIWLQFEDVCRTIDAVLNGNSDYSR
ncbi:MAG: endonuclease domain-containing protein [Clostridia bacterium]|nr:endonuclease domain-containing protein [Clostridia bacterium]